MTKTEEQLNGLEVQNLTYHHSFSKKVAKKTGTDLGKSLVDDGEVNLYDALGNIVRLKEVLGAAEAVIKNSDAIYKEADSRGGHNRNGVNFATSSTGDRLDYEADPVCKQLMEQVKDRQADLKKAFQMKQKGKTHFVQAFDPETGEEYAEEVPVVPIKTVGKQTIKVTF